MYRAKAAGRRRWIAYDPDMRRSDCDRVELEMALRQALARGELRVAYQPVVAIGTGSVVAAEALVRWDRPGHGPVPPGRFIQVAEDAGLIAELGTLVLTQALTAAAGWRRDGAVAADFRIAVNVSARELRDDRVLRTVRRLLAETGLPPAAVTLEITESVMLDRSELTERLLLDLRAEGLNLVVDDFGTGFSALGYLLRHPVTGVKIDQGFVGGLGGDGSDEEIVRAVVAMSSALGLSVVAEGVETTAQRDVLAALGVRIGQGRLWGMAVPAEEFVAAARRPSYAG